MFANFIFSLAFQVSFPAVESVVERGLKPFDTRPKRQRLSLFALSVRLRFDVCFIDKLNIRWNYRALDFLPRPE